MMRPALASVATMLAILAVVAGCGGDGVPPAAKTTTDAPAPLLSAAELTGLFLGGDSVAWKFTAAPPLAARSIGLELIDDGVRHPLGEIAVPAGQPVADVIVVVVGDAERPTVKLRVRYGGGSAMTTGSTWFATPLALSSWSTHDSAQPLRSGRTTLVSGIHGPLASGSSALDSADAPCRCVLVVE